MCDERERLIGYLYEEGDAEERRQVETHLESCSTCRAEIGALRSVRTDLLAWAVPEHSPIWRPMPEAVAPPVVWWRQTPGWALAAAAAVVLAAGIAGGAAMRLMSPPPVPAQVAGVTADELTAAQQQIVSMLRAELDRVKAENIARVEQLASPVTPDGSAAVERRVLDQLRESDRKTLDQINTMFVDVLKMNRNADQNIRRLAQEIEMIKATMSNQGGGR